MKCIKPNAFLEIQGISTEMENTDNQSNLTEVPQILRLDSLLDLIESNAMFLNTSASSAQLISNLNNAEQSFKNSIFEQYGNVPNSKFKVQQQAKASLSLSTYSVGQQSDATRLQNKRKLAQDQTPPQIASPEASPGEQEIKRGTLLMQSPALSPKHLTHESIQNSKDSLHGRNVYKETANIITLDGSHSPPDKIAQQQPTPRLMVNTYRTKAYSSMQCLSAKNSKSSNSYIEMPKGKLTNVQSPLGKKSLTKQQQFTRITPYKELKAANKLTSKKLEKVPTKGQKYNDQNKSCLNLSDMFCIQAKREKQDVEGIADIYDAYLSDPTIEEEMKQQHPVAIQNQPQPRKLTINVHENYRNDEQNNLMPEETRANHREENTRNQMPSRLKERAIHAVVSPGIKSGKRSKMGQNQIKNPKIQITLGPQKIFPGSPQQNFDDIMRASKRQLHTNQQVDSQKKTSSKQKKTRPAKLIPYSRPHNSITDNQLTPSSNGGQNSGSNANRAQMDAIRSYGPRFQNLNTVKKEPNKIVRAAVPSFQGPTTSVEPAEEEKISPSKRLASDELSNLSSQSRKGADESMQIINSKGMSLKASVHNEENGPLIQRKSSHQVNSQVSNKILNLIGTTKGPKYQPPQSRGLIQLNSSTKQTPRKSVALTKAKLPREMVGSGTHKNNKVHALNSQNSNACDTSIKSINQLNDMFPEQSIRSKLQEQTKQNLKFTVQNRITDRKSDGTSKQQKMKPYDNHPLSLKARRPQTARPDPSTQKEIKDEDIGDEEEEKGAEITLDSMTRMINQNMHNLGSNNPFQHEKLVKPSSKGIFSSHRKSGAMTHRVATREETILSQSKPETKKNYVVIKNPRQQKAQQNFKNTQIKELVGLAWKNNESPLYPNSARIDKPTDGIQKPAIFTKNSVLESREEQNSEYGISIKTKNHSSKPISDMNIKGATGQMHLTNDYSTRILKDLITHQYRKNQGPGSQIVPTNYDAIKVCFQLELQIRHISNQIFKIWHKMSRIIYLDPVCIKTVLRKKYEKQVTKYYSQMVVECENETKEEIEDSDGESGMRFTIKDSWVRKPNAVIKTWDQQEQRPKNTIQQRNNSMFQETVGDEEKNERNNKLIMPTSPLKAGERFSFGHNSQGEKQNTIQANNIINEEAAVYVPNSRQFQKRDQESCKSVPRQEVKSLKQEPRGRNRDKSASNFGGRPLSPNHIEKSKVLAKNRREDTSKIRDKSPTVEPQQHSKSSSCASSVSSYAIKQSAKQRTNPFKKKQYKLPMQEIIANTNGRVIKPDFEPIIIEEVYYNGDNPQAQKKSRNSVAITPSVMLKNALKISLHEQKKLFLPTDKVDVEPLQEMANSHRVIEKKFEKRQDKSFMNTVGSRLPLAGAGNKNAKTFEQVDHQSGEESCDLFSDNLSETQSNRSLSVALSNLATHQKRQYHLFVFVHGFQASSADMRSFRNSLQLLLPNAMFLVSHANEKNTDARIEDLGLRLAAEVQEFIFNNLNNSRSKRSAQQCSLSKITFIGHSLGGIIVREALKHLKTYKKLLHGYISLGSPHLGYMYNSSSLIDAGMWVIKQVKGSTSLQQLSMTDATDTRNTYLYKLSQQDTLSDFKFIIFVSSYQDNYAPHDSCRVQMCSQASQQDENRGKYYVQMVENILSSMTCKRLYRLDVNFKIEDKSLASLIGRTAHILLIECQEFYMNLIYRYRDVFCE